MGAGAVLIEPPKREKANEVTYGEATYGRAGAVLIAPPKREKARVFNREATSYCDAVPSMAPSAWALVVKDPSQGYSSVLPFLTFPGVAKDWPTHKR